MEHPPPIERLWRQCKTQVTLVASLVVGFFLNKRPLPTYPPPLKRLCGPTTKQPDSSLWESEIRISYSRSASVKGSVCFFSKGELRKQLILCRFWCLCFHKCYDKFEILGGLQWNLISKLLSATVQGKLRHRSHPPFPASSRASYQGTLFHFYSTGMNKFLRLLSHG